MTSAAFYATYQNVEQISKGGTGVIYRAYHMNLGKNVILKHITLRQEMSFLRREVDILKNLRHRYLPVIYDFIEVEGNYFIVEDYITGVDLNYYIKNHIYIPEDVVVKWIWQLCEVLDYLHSRTPAVYHSDIKPGNVMIDENGDICLIDFNISVFRGAAENVLGFSNYYCAPEQVQKAKNPALSVVIDARTDIYSMAATFYTLLSGAVPRADVPNPPLAQMGLSYSEGLLRLLDKAMQFDIQKRWQSAVQVQNQLKRLDRLTRASQRALRISLAGFVISALLLTAGTVSLIHGLRMRQIDRVSQRAEAVFSEYDAWGPTDEAARMANELLFDREAVAVLDREPQKLAQCYLILAENAWDKDSLAGYATAADYYGQALSLLDGSENVNAEYRLEVAVNYACALAMSGNADLARSVSHSRIQDENSLYAKAVDVLIAFNQGSYDTVVSLAAGIPEGRDHPDLRYKLYRIVALAAEKSSAGIRQAVVWLEKAGEVETSSAAMRYIAKYMMAAGNILSDETLYAKAETYFDRIRDKTPADTVDRAELKVLKGEYAACEELLNTVGASEDRAILCKADYVWSLSYARQRNLGMAKDRCAQAIDIYNSLTREQKKGIDRSALENLRQQLGVEKEIAS